MAYVSPGGAFTEGLEGFLLQQKQLEHQQLMDRISIARDQREQLRLKLEMEDKDKENVKARIAAMQPGDVPDQELQVKAKKYGLDLKTAPPLAGPGQQFMQPGTAPEIANPEQKPGAYAGSPVQQFGMKMERGEMTPSQALGGAIRVGPSMPPGMFGAVERYAQQQTKPVAVKWTPGLIDAEQLPQGAKDVEGNEIKGAPGTKYKMGLKGDQEVFQPQAKAGMKEQFWRDTASAKLYHPNAETGVLEPWNGPVPHDALINTAALKPASQYKATDQGLVEVQPTRGASIAPGARGSIRPPVAPPAGPPQANAAAPPQANAGAAPPVAGTAGATRAGGPQARQVMGPNGQPLYPPSGPPVTEAGAEPFAVLLAAGVSPNKLMSMGMAGSMRNTVANLAGEYRKGLKPIPADLLNLPGWVTDVEARQKTMDFLKKQGASASTSANIARENLKLAEEAGEKVVRSDAAFINRLTNKALREAGVAVQGSTDVGQLSDFETKIYTAIREYAKVASGSSGSVAGLSEGATHEATALLNSAQSPEAFKAAVRAMEADMDNIIAGWNSQYEQFKGQMNERINPGASKTKKTPEELWKLYGGKQ